MSSLRPNLPHRPGSAASFIFDVPNDRHEVVLAEAIPSNIHTPLSNFAAPELSDTSLSSTSFVVISGGTGCNSICAAFGEDVSYVLPVSDNGGSSSEIIRVLGGPSIGDIRSRLIRLIPPASPSSPSERIRRLLSFRFPPEATEREARDGWRDIVEGRSDLWSGIPADRKETIRGFLVYFDGEVLKRANKSFSFRNASIGNFFLTAAHRFFRSVPSSIFLFSSITGSKADILPVLVTNHTVTIAAELRDGRILVGQCEISHPSRPPIPSIVNMALPEGRGSLSYDDDDLEVIDALGDEGAAHANNVEYTKGSDEEYDSLGSPIHRVFYINQYGQEIFPIPNPRFIKDLGTKSVMVYSCGSLYTSIMPCLALRSVASTIARSRSLRAKVLLLNGKNDRETEGYSAADYIHAITNILNRHDKPNSQSDQSLEETSSYPISAFITHLVYLRGTTIPINVEEVAGLGVACVEIEPADERILYNASSVEEGLLKVLAMAGTSVQTYT